MTGWLVCCLELYPPKPLDQSKYVTIRSYHKLSKDQNGPKQLAKTHTAAGRDQIWSGLNQLPLPSPPSCYCYLHHLIENLWTKRTFELCLQLMCSIGGNLANLTYHNHHMHTGWHGWSIFLMWLLKRQYWMWPGCSQMMHQQSLKFKLGRKL